MHRDSSTYTTPDGKTYTRRLLRESFRSGGKVLKRTLANLSHLEPGSRLSAVRLARRLEADRRLGLGPFDEDDLYGNLDWLCVQQQRIEDRLFAHRCR